MLWVEDILLFWFFDWIVNIYEIWVIYDFHFFFIYVSLSIFDDIFWSFACSVRPSYTIYCVTLNAILRIF
jgi:hypothetical protein